jgi:heat shock protein HtpX
MGPAPAVIQSALVYNRVVANRLRTWLLVAVAIAAIVPFVAAVSYGATWTVFGYFDRPAAPVNTISAAQERQIRARIEEYPEEYRERIREHFERRLAAERAARAAALAREKAQDTGLRYRVVVLVSVALLSVLGLLFWALASSPTSRLLAMCGARPAGMAAVEVEAKRSLENLAIGARLPTPKLYVIDTSALNAFAAGVDPRRSVVAVTSGILGLLDRRELESVLAHELSHIGNRDTRLNTIVASIALFLRLPHLLRRQGRNRREQAGDPVAFYPRFGMMYRWALLPLYIYIFIIAPVLAAAIRAVISRGREYLADADAALLTRDPEGLIRALSKIGGAGSVVAGSNPAVSHLYFADPSAVGSGLDLLTGGLLATHPPIDRRINRLVEFNGGAPVSVIESAVRAGQEFTRDHPPIQGHNLLDNVTSDELAVVNMGNPAGRVFQVIGAKGSAPIYDRSDFASPVIARVASGDLLIVFDDPGSFRQVITHNQTFGYLPLSVKLKRIDMLPAEIHDPAARAAFQAQATARANAAATARAVPAVAAAGSSGLTPAQIRIAFIFAAVVFLCGLLALIFLPGK